MKGNTREIENKIIVNAMNVSDKFYIIIALFSKQQKFIWSVTLVLQSV